MNIKFTSDPLILATLLFKSYCIQLAPPLDLENRRCFTDLHSDDPCDLFSKEVIAGS